MCPLSLTSEIVLNAIIDIAILNSHVVFHTDNPGRRKPRSDFIKGLGTSLINGHMKIRSVMPNLF